MQQEKWQPSPIPYYLAGGVWLLYGLIFPLYRWWDFLIAAALSAALFLLGRKLFPGKAVWVEVPDPQPQPTGDSLADQILAEGREYTEQLRQLNDAIADAELSSKISRIEELSKKILDHIAQFPKKAPLVRKFLNYYLPSVLKLLRSYDVLDDQEIEGKHISDTMRRIESAMDLIIPAFEKQLDALFQDEALDIMTDISVLEGMLAQEGLGEDAFHMDDSDPR